MKLAKIGLVFKIFVILLILLSTALTVLLFQDVRRIGEHSGELLSTSSDFGNITGTSPTIIREEGKVVKWNLSLGSIQLKNLGKRLTIESLQLKVNVINKTLGKPLIELSSEKDVRINPGEMKEIGISLLIYRVTFTKATTFLFRALRWRIFQEVNTTFPNVSLDVGVWNSSIFTKTVFNTDLLEEIIVNGTILNQSTANEIHWDALFNMTTFHDSLVSHTSLNDTDLEEIDLDLDQLMDTIPGIDDFLGSLLRQATFEAEIFLSISILNIPFLKITVQPSEELFSEIGAME